MYKCLLWTGVFGSVFAVNSCVRLRCILQRGVLCKTGLCGQMCYIKCYAVNRCVVQDRIL